MLVHVDGAFADNHSDFYIYIYVLILYIKMRTPSSVKQKSSVSEIIFWTTYLSSKLFVRVFFSSLNLTAFFDILPYICFRWTLWNHQQDCVSFHGFVCVRKQISDPVINYCSAAERCGMPLNKLDLCVFSVAHETNLWGSLIAYKVSGHKLALGGAGGNVLNLKIKYTLTNICFMYLLHKHTETTWRGEGNNCINTTF